MYKTLVIVSKNNINLNHISIDYMIVPEFKITSSYQGIFENEIIDFDYLIISEKINNHIMTEDGYIITNDCFETSVDNYFAIGEKVKTNKSIDEQLNIIIEYIKGNI